MDFSLIQIAIVLVIALLVFGPKRLPELGRSLGSGMREFRQTISGMGDDLMSDDEPSKSPKQASAGDSAASAESADREAVVESKG